MARKDNPIATKEEVEEVLGTYAKGIIKTGKASRGLLQKGEQAISNVLRPRRKIDFSQQRKLIAMRNQRRRQKSLSQEQYLRQQIRLQNLRKRLQQSYPAPLVAQTPQESLMLRRLAELENAQRKTEISQSSPIRRAEIQNRINRQKFENMRTANILKPLPTPKIDLNALDTENSILQTPSLFSSENPYNNVFRKVEGQPTILSGENQLQFGNSNPPIKKKKEVKVNLW